MLACCLGWSMDNHCKHHRGFQAFARLCWPAVCGWSMDNHGKHHRGFQAFVCWSAVCGGRWTTTVNTIGAFKPLHVYAGLLRLGWSMDNHGKQHCNPLHASAGLLYVGWSMDNHGKHHRGLSSLCTLYVGLLFWGRRWITTINTILGNLLRFL